MGFGKKKTKNNSNKNIQVNSNRQTTQNRKTIEKKRNQNSSSNGYLSQYPSDFEEDYSDLLKQSMQQEGFFDNDGSYNRKKNIDTYEYEQDLQRANNKKRYNANDNKANIRKNNSDKQTVNKSRRKKKSKLADRQGIHQTNERIEADENIGKKKSVNREILVVTYIFIGLFVILLVNFTHFLLSDSKTVINNTYNKRQDLLAERVVRGQILSKDKEVLAQTVVDDKGNEKRVYPYKNLFTHVVGTFDRGKTGIELSENFNLLTSNANPIEKVMNELSEKKNVGDNIVTTLDVKLQKAAYNALGNHKGAVVALEPSTGKILAMVSRPDFDPNKVSTLWDSLVKDEDNRSALLNRATQGLYPPGSTFKIVTALEYLREHSDYKKFEYTCTGKYTIGDMTINCHNKKVHGHIDLKKAFTKSCNSAFASISTDLNRVGYKNTAQELLFNKELPLTFPYRKSSFSLDSSSDKKLAAQTAIGQGNTLISPMHNAMIASAIANGGTLMKPYIVDHIENYVGDVVKKNMPSAYGDLMTAKEAKTLTNMMEDVVNNGTAYRLKSNRYQAAGKTGSAEFNSGKASHAWFVGFAPADNPDIVVSVIVEGAGTGGDYAVPIAKKVLDTYYNK